MVKRLVVLSSLLFGCGPPPPAVTSAAPPAERAASATPPQPSPAEVVRGPAAPAPALPYTPCGDLGCKEFPTAAAAFAHVLTEGPRVLAVGEAHAQAAGPKSPSSTLRFMNELLPLLAPRASDLVIELWLGTGGCGKVEQSVQKQQSAVTAPQAATNQNEFLELGHRAKALGIMPHALVPTCEQYEKIARAGADDIAEMLTMLKTVTERDVKELLAKRSSDRLIVAYGGALHNDLAPRAGREDFSFGPALSSATEGRYVELDLVIPEQIKDSEAWRALPWYPHYSQERAGKGAYLYSWAPHAYVLFFPRSGDVQPEPKP
jgi:hypothetical protein